MSNIAPFEAARSGVQRMQAEIVKLLPVHVTFDRFERIVATALRKTPTLLNCDQNSLFEAVTLCATDGLMPDGREAALVVFKGRVAYMPMVAGIVKRIHQSGELVSLTSQVVYADDVFRYWTDEHGEHIVHEPNMASTSDKIICVYAQAKTRNGGTFLEVLRLADIEKIKNTSRSKDTGPWKDWFAEMAKKSAIRRLSKTLPMSFDTMDLIARDNQFHELSSSEGEETTPPKAKTKASAPRAKASLDALSSAKRETQKEEVILDADVVDDVVSEDEY